MVKIGVISDTHLTGYDPGLAEALARHFQGVEMILHAGDVIDLPALDIFAGTPLVLVAGNMDAPGIRKIAPLKRTVRIGTCSIGLIHGWGAPEGIEERIRKEFEEVDVLVYGHTHRAVSAIKQGVLFFNPGSATDTRFAPFNSIGLLEVNDRVTTSIIRL